MCVCESDGSDEEAYRTWDFLLLAKSRLQRLGDSVDWDNSGADGGYASSGPTKPPPAGTGYDAVPAGYDNNMAATGYRSMNVG